MKRKGFNFYVSYYEVLDTLTDKEALQYLRAILEREFNGIHPNLESMLPMSRFAYISQRHSIDAQVVGFEQKTEEPLTPIRVSTQGGIVGGSGQEKGEVQGKEEVKCDLYPFESFWDLYDKKVGDKVKIKKKYEGLSDEVRAKIFNHVPKYKLAQPDKTYRKNPETYLNNSSWKDEIIGVKTSQPQQQTIKMPPSIYKDL